MNQKTSARYAAQAAAATVLTALLCGCQTVVTPAAIPPGGAASGAVPAGQEEPITPAELVQRLNLAVRATPANPESAALTALVERQAIGHLVARGQTLRPDAADLAVELSVRQSVFDRSGEFVLLEGEVDGSFKRVYDGKLLGHDRLSARGTRELGDEKAMASVAAALAPKVEAWLAQACEPARIPLAACQLTLRRERKLTLNAAPFHADYAGRFVKAVAGMPGVLRCDLTGEDPQARLMTFRVLYLKEQYPQGLLNAVIAAHPELNLAR